MKIRLKNFPAHFEGQKKGVRVRGRIDGTLRVFFTLSTNIAKKSGFSLALPKMLLGHSEKTAKRYNHLVESVTKKLHHNNKDFENLKKVS